LQGHISIINKNKAQLKTDTATFYNSVTGAKLKNLEGEMPYTVAMLKQGKKFEDLDGNQQAAIMLEAGSNVSNYMASGRDKNLLDSVLYSVKAGLENHKSEKVKAIYNIANRAFERRNAETFKAVSLRGGAGVTFMLNEGKLSPRQDTDVLELEEYTGDVSKNTADIFRGTLNNMSTHASSIADGYKSNLTSNKALSWSTEDKYQKPRTLELKSAVQTAFPDLKVATTNNYIVSRNGSGFDINFDDADGNRITKYVEKLPNKTMEALNLKEQEWHSNLNNPNIILPEYKFSPKMKKESYEKFKQVAQVRPDIISTDMYITIHNRGSLKGTEFQSDEDVMEWVETHPNITKDKQDKISNIINSTYDVGYNVVDGRLVGTITIKNKNGKEDSVLMMSSQNELDEGKLYIEAMQQINEYKGSKLEQILNAK